MASRLSGQTSTFGGDFFVSKSLLGIEGQKELNKFAIQQSINLYLVPKFTFLQLDLS